MTSRTFVALILGLLSTIVVARPNADDPVGIELLEKTRRASERLDAFSCDIDSVCELAGGKKLVWTHHIERRQDHYRIEFAGIINVGPREGPTRRMRQTGCLIFNDSHTIIAETLEEVGPMMVEVYEHAPVIQENSREQMRRDPHIPFLLAQCALWKPSSVQSWIEHSAPDSHWSAEKIDAKNGTTLYRVQRWKTEPRDLQVELIIDPQHGDLITEQRVYLHGKLYEETSVRFERLVDGSDVFRAAELTERCWRTLPQNEAATQPERPLERTVHYRITNFTCEPPPAERFTLASARDFGEHDRIMLFHFDGRQADARVVDGEIVDVKDMEVKK